MDTATPVRTANGEHDGADTNGSHSDADGARHQATRPKRDPERSRASFVSLVLVLGVVALFSVFAFSPISGNESFILDRELIFYLSGKTAAGAVPLVDFQHGWNTGGWWVGSLLYRLADGSPNLFAFLFDQVFGRMLTAATLAIAAWRLGRSAAVVAVVGIGTTLFDAAVAPHGKYAIPALWLLVVLPTEGTPGPRRRRRAPVAYAAVAFVTLWLHVELAVLLSAGVALFELFGRRHGNESLRSRLTRVAALAVGAGLGAAAEVVYYARQGISVSTVNDFVFGGQATGFDEQYGWSMTDPASSAGALYPLLVLVAFTPVLWRRAAPATCLAACLSLALAIVAIRRPDAPHVSAASTLFVFTGVMLADDVRRSPLGRPDWSGGPRVWVTVVVGAMWSVAMLLGFEVESLFAVGGLAAGAVLLILAGRSRDLPWLSAGVALPLLLIAAVGSATVLHDRVQSSDPFAQANTNAQLIAPEVDRCLGDDRRAVIATSQLSLYDYLGLHNPTPYYQFHYDFARYAPDLVDEMASGRVPAFVEVYQLPSWMDAVRTELERHFTLCATVGAAQTGNSINIWVKSDRTPDEYHNLQFGPDGTLLSAHSDPL